MKDFGILDRDLNPIPKPRDLDLIGRLHQTRAMAKDLFLKVRSHDTGSFRGERGEERARALLASDLGRLKELHSRLVADGTRSVFVVLQGMDASGKDGLVRHLCQALNPHGVRAHSLKAPNELERRHGFLWRVHLLAPAAGGIAILNRSHYEEVTTVRVHPEFLDSQALPKQLRRNLSRLFADRFRQINDFERYLSENGTLVVKYFLHISQDEQRERLLERLDQAEKNWKFNENDLKTRALWSRYQTVWEEAIEKTSSKSSPWVIVPADRKWYRNFFVTRDLIQRLERLDLRYPKIDPVSIKRLKRELGGQA